MANTELFEASQNGNATKLRAVIQETAELDINAKDSQGVTALGYGARNGHVEVVQLLLAHGAEANEVVERGYGLENPDIAPLFGREASNEARHAQQESETGAHNAAVAAPVDAHGGRQMPDGTVSYMNAHQFSQGYPQPAHMGGPQFYNGSIQSPTYAANGEQQHNSGHARSDSNANLPPPDIARVIPCRYFPNCRYGDKCVFAHPVDMNAIAHMPPQQAHPLSPSMSPPPMMQPMFYQQLPPGYPYPPYGAAAHQPFIPMGPPGPMGHYGMPPHFAPGMLQPQPHPAQQQQQPPTPSAASASHSPSAPEIPQAASMAQEGSGQSSSANAAQPEQFAEADNKPNGVEASSIDANDAEPNSITATESTRPSQGAEGDAAEHSEATTDNTQSQGHADAAAKPVHRRQSFNSFLHHHAVPFQPQNGDMLNPYASRGNVMGPGKARRSNFGGINGVQGPGNGKKGGNSTERPPCTFFAAGRCRYGDECRFPHILADGTDARPMQAQQRQAFASQFAPASGAASTRNGPSVNGAHASQNGNASAPASAPTGPQADKKAQQPQKTEQQQQQQQQHNARAHDSQQGRQSQPSEASQSASQPSANGVPKTTSGSQQASGPKATAGSGQNNIVRSNPSKTSSQAAAAAAATSSRGNKKQHHKHENNQGNGQQQQASATASQQRVPTVNDFPALSSPGHSTNGAPSPQPPASVAFPDQTEFPSPQTDAHNAKPVNGTKTLSNGSTSAPMPRVNFSAILSAPAPAKSKSSPQPASGEAQPLSVDADSKDHAETESKSPVPAETHAKPMSAAEALASAPAATPTTKANGTAVAPSASKSQQGSNGRPASQKPRAGPRESSSSTNSGKGSQPNGVHRSAAPANAKSGTSSEVNGNAGPDDDFQLVNRSRSHNRRSTSNNNNNGGSASNSGKGGESFAAHAKAVAA